MNASSFISHNLIISEIAKKSGDPEFKFESESYYMSLVQEALQELSFDTFFLDVEQVYDLSDGCMKLTLPSGFFNIKEIFGYSGSDCNPQGKVNVYWKDNYKNKISRDNWQNNGDPYYKQRGASNPPGGLYYAGYSNGVIHLSDNCKGLAKVVVRANGLLTDVGDIPTIPMFFRQAVVDYGIVDALSIRTVSNPAEPAVAIWMSTMNRYEKRLNRKYDGSWDKAMHRAKTMDSKTAKDLKEYFSRLDIG